MITKTFYSNLYSVLQKELNYPVTFGKLNSSSSTSVVLDFSVDDNYFYIDLIYVPYQVRGLGYTEKILNILRQILPRFGVGYVSVFPFPSDINDYKRQRYANINKLVKFYRNLGFVFKYRDAFRSYFLTSGDNISYSRYVYYDDLSGCNEMILKL